MLKAFLIFLQKFLMPEVLEYIENYLNENGRLPTLDELNASVFTETNLGIAEGTDWLKTHGND